MIEFAAVSTTLPSSRERQARSAQRIALVLRSRGAHLADGSALARLRGKRNSPAFPQLGGASGRSCDCAVTSFSP
jgi:hypothetical protein